MNLNLKTLLLIQALAVSFFLVTLYVIVLRIESFEKRRFKDSFDNLDYNNENYEEENGTGIIKNQYIVVLRDNATFIDEYSRSNWIKKVFDENNESYSKIIHYYSLPKYVGWNTPSESMRILSKSEQTESFKGFAAKLSPDMYEYFVNHPSVKFVECDEYVQLDDIVEDSSSNDKLISKPMDNDDQNYDDDDVNISSVVYKTKSSLNLSRLINHEPVTDINNAYYKFGYESAYDVYAYVVDTGVNANHVGFLDKLGYDTENKNRVTIGKNYVTTEENVDNNGHGTHVAGIIGSTAWGVAKRINIVSVKVMNQKGSGKWSDIIAAIEWSQNHLSQTNSNKGIINISLSGNVKTSANNAIKASIAQGMHFSVAAGNNSKDACQFSPASASVYGAVVVGSVTSDDSLSKFSNFGSCITIFAPGNKIASTSNVDNNLYKEMSGTSMASPHVAGVMALILSYNNMTPTELYSTLLREASSGYIKDLDDDSPNLIAYIPNYAIASRCNPIDPYDCIGTSKNNYKNKNDEDEEIDAEKSYKSRKNNLNFDEFFLLQN